MSNKESFAPGVVVPGYGTVHPPGWMWVLGFALGGCEWAIKEANTEEFREIARKWYRDQEKLLSEEYIANLEKKLEDARLTYQERYGETDAIE